MKLILIVCLVPSVLCWRPIAGPSASTFSLKQSHPARASVASPKPALLTKDSTVAPSYDSAIFSSYFGDGNEFLDDNAQGHEGSHFDTTDGRILAGKSYFQGKIFNGLLGGGGAGGHGGGSCGVDKYAFEHEGTVNYDASLPHLEQFTLCLWMRFTNHSGDHVLFTYSVDDEPREIQLWVANARGASYISMAVHGQSLFRLNYPFIVRKWHHACASWNGKTGEWQLWIKAERVGRGFHNRLVNFKVRPHGLTYSGGSSITGKVTENLHNEVTLIQLYKIALSAGKAHRDHKHHHVHHFDHNGPVAVTTPPPPPPPVAPQPINPLLANGQFPSRVRINLAGGPSTPVPPALPSQVVGGVLPQQPLTIQTQFVNGQFHTGGRHIVEQLLTGNLQSKITLAPSPTVFTFPGPSSPSPTSYLNVQQPANVQYIDDTQAKSRFIFKRETGKSKKSTSEVDSQKKIDKRGLVMLSDGSIIDDDLLDQDQFVFDGLAQFGLPAFKASLMQKMNIEDEIKEHDREPAEGEVQAVMAVCSACDQEPFSDALIIGWKNLRGRTSKVLRAKTLGQCGEF